jgi:hypothetical protein
MASFDRPAIAAAKNLINQSLPSADRLLDALNSFQTVLTWSEKQKRIQALLECELQRDADFEKGWPVVLGTLPDDAEVLQFLERCQQVRHRPSPPVQSPHQHDIDLAAGAPLPAACRAVAVRMRRYPPPSLAGLSPSLVGRRTRGGRGHTTGWSAGRWWTRGRRDRRETFRWFRAWPKTLADLAFADARLTAISA